MRFHTIKYSEPLVREAVLLYWRKQTGFVFPVATVFLCGYLGYLLSIGTRSWLVGVLGTVVVVSVTMMAAFYFVHLSRSLKRLRSMQTPEVKLEFNEEKFKLTSELGASEVQWATIKKLWRFENVWLLVFSGFGVLKDAS